MAKRRAKKTTKQPPSSPVSSLKDGAQPKELLVEKKDNESMDPEVERQIAAIRAIRDVEVERLLNALRLLRSNFSNEQQKVPLLQFFKETLPNLIILRNERGGPGEVRLKDKDANISTSQADGRNIHASLLHRMSMAYPDYSAALSALGGFEFSSKAVKTSLLGADNLQRSDSVFEEPFDTQILGLQDGLQTPGVSSSQRLSVGMTPKTVRLPKHGEMLLSVHGSPLGVYKEDNMEAIHESEEG